MTQREQRLKNLEDVNKRRREATHCKRNHSDWEWFKEKGRLRRRCRICRLERTRLGPKEVPGPLGLYNDEVKILQAAADGYNVEAAAKKLYFSKASIVAKRMRIFKKLNVSTIEHAVAQGFRNGIIT